MVGQKIVRLHGVNSLFFLYFHRYRSQIVHESHETSPGLVGHIHLNKVSAFFFNKLIFSNVASNVNVCLMFFIIVIGWLIEQTQLNKLNILMHDVLDKCLETIILHQKKKKVGNLFKRIDLSVRLVSAVGCAISVLNSGLG